MVYGLSFEEKFYQPICQMSLLEKLGWLLVCVIVFSLYTMLLLSDKPWGILPEGIILPLMPFPRGI